MKKFLCVVLILILFAGCKPVDDDFMLKNEDFVGSSEETKTEENKIYNIKTSVPYIKSEIPIEAQLTVPNKAYSYKIIERLHPKLNALYEVFPQLKDNLRARADEKGRIVPAAKYTGEGETRIIVQEEFGEVVIRQQFQSEERVDNQYSNDENMEFSMSYNEVEKLALDTAKKFFEDCSFVVYDVRKFGKYSGKNYYMLTLEQTLDGVIFSSFGRKTQKGKDSEGYDEYTTLRGGNHVTVYIDEEGISEISWRVQKLENLKEEKILDINSLLQKFAQQITMFSVNNYADCTQNSDKSFKEVKPYKITKIELIWALDYVSENEIAYVPSVKLTSYDSKGYERYTVINAINGEVLLTRF